MFSMLIHKVNPWGIAKSLGSKQEQERSADWNVGWQILPLMYKIFFHLFLKGWLHMTMQCSLYEPKIVRLDPICWWWVNPVHFVNQIVILVGFIGITPRGNVLWIQNYWGEGLTKQEYLFPIGLKWSEEAQSCSSQIGPCWSITFCFNS